MGKAHSKARTGRESHLPARLTMTQPRQLPTSWTAPGGWRLTDHEWRHLTQDNGGVELVQAGVGLLVSEKDTEGGAAGRDLEDVGGKEYNHDKARPVLDHKQNNHHEDRDKKAPAGRGVIKPGSVTSTTCYRKTCLKHNTLPPRPAAGRTPG